MTFGAQICAHSKLSGTSWPPLCAVFVFNRVYYIPHPASGMDRVAGMVADWLSLHERLIGQSGSKNISLRVEFSEN